MLDDHRSAPRHRRARAGITRAAARVLGAPRSGLFATFALAAAACAGGPNPDAAERAAVDAALDSVYATFTRAYAGANVQLLMDEVYARDAFYLPPGSPILEGQDQFRGQFSAFLEAFAREDRPGPSISFEIVDRAVSGDLATDIGTYTLRPPGAPAEAAGSRGKFIVIWKRNPRGEWRIHADGFSAIE